MDRFRPTSLVAALLVAVAAVGIGAGCNAVATAWWVLKDGKTQPAEYKQLNGKKVAVVVRGPAQAMFRQNHNAPFQIAKNVNRLLRSNLGKKTQLVPAEKVEKVTDAGEWSEFTEIGKQLDVEQVVAIDVDEFSTNLSSTIYSGRASISIAVYDMNADGDVTYRKAMQNIQYPPTTGGQPADGMSPKQFTDRFIFYLADHIARNFYDHDPRADFAGWGAHQ